MSELEIDLELFAVHFVLTGSGDSLRMGSGDSPHVVGRRGQSPNGQYLKMTQ